MERKKHDSARETCNMDESGVWCDDGDGDNVWKGGAQQQGLCPPTRSAARPPARVPASAYPPQFATVLLPAQARGHDERLGPQLRHRCGLLAALSTGCCVL